MGLKAVANRLGGGSPGTFTNLTVTGVETFSGAGSGFADGTAASPSIPWASDNDGSGTGFFRGGANVISVSTNGTERWRWSSTGAFLPIATATMDVGGPSNVVRTGYYQSIVTRVRSLAVDTVLTITDSVVLTTTAAGAVTHTLPAANGVGAGNTIRITVRKTNSSANALTVQRAGSDTVDGGTSVAIADLSARDFVSDGVSAWWSV